MSEEGNVGDEAQGRPLGMGQGQAGADASPGPCSEAGVGTDVTSAGTASDEPVAAGTDEPDHPARVAEATDGVSPATPEFVDHDEFGRPLTGLGCDDDLDDDEEDWGYGHDGHVLALMRSLEELVDRVSESVEADQGLAERQAKSTEATARVLEGHQGAIAGLIRDVADARGRVEQLEDRVERLESEAESLREHAVTAWALAGGTVGGVMFVLLFAGVMSVLGVW